MLLPAGAGLEAMLHAAATQPGASWAGWAQPPAPSLAKRRQLRLKPQLSAQSTLARAGESSDEEVAALAEELTAEDPLADADRSLSPQARCA